MIDEQVPIPANATLPAALAKAELEKRWKPTGFEWVAEHEINSPKILYLCSEQQSGLSGISNAVDTLLNNKPCVLYHNHPSNDPLSPSDYANFQRYPILREMWAYGHNGTAWYSITISQSLPSATVNDIPETATMEFVTALGLSQNDVTNSAFRQGFAEAVEALTSGRYQFSVLGTTYAIRENETDISKIRVCANLITMACFKMVSDPNAATARSNGLLDVLSCLQTALSKGRNYSIRGAISTSQLSNLAKTLYHHCSTLENWVRSI
jgi:hypothetical protein